MAEGKSEEKGEGTGFFEKNTVLRLTFTILKDSCEIDYTAAVLNVNRII